MVENQGELVGPKLPGSASLAPLPDYEMPWDDSVEQTVKPKFPLIKIAYENSKGLPEDCPKGMLFNNLTGEVFEKKLVLLLYATTCNILQHKYDPNAEQQAPIICKSIDGRVPSGGSDPLQGPCRRRRGGQMTNVCPKLQWTEVPGGKNIPPECNATYVLLLWDLDTDVPCIMGGIKKKAVQEFEALKSHMTYKMHQMIDPENPQIPPNLLTPIELSTKVEGIYFLPDFKLMIGQDHRVGKEYAEKIMPQVKLLISQMKALDPDYITDADQASPSNGSDDEVPY